MFKFILIEIYFNLVTATTLLPFSRPIITIDGVNFAARSVVFDLDPKLYPKHFIKYIERTKQSYVAWTQSLSRKWIEKIVERNIIIKIYGPGGLCFWFAVRLKRRTVIERIVRIRFAVFRNVTLTAAPGSNKWSDTAAPLWVADSSLSHI